MKHRLALVMKLVKNHGFFKTLFLLLKMMFFKLLDMSFSSKNARTIENAIAGKTVIVFTKAIEWNNMFQRIQQMALEFSKRENVVVIYVENCTTYDFFANIKQMSNSLFCFSFRHYKELDTLLTEAENVILYVTNLFELDYNLELHYDKMVYEYVDELELFFDDMKLAEETHQKAIKSADLCIATAAKLLKQLEPTAKKAILSPNAVDFETFSKSKTTPLAPQLQGVISKYDIVIGYYGALASWFDFKLICEVAKKKPNWLIVLIGTLFDDTASKFSLHSYKNILTLGAQPYKNLPSFIRGIDILTIPFLVNNITESTSPVKLFEYMASGTPILTSQLPECKKYESVYRYSDAEEFIEQAQSLFEKKNSPQYQAILLKEANENTWSNRVDDILKALSDVEL